MAAPFSMSMADFTTTQPRTLAQPAASGPLPFGDLALCVPCETAGSRSFVASDGGSRRRQTAASATDRLGLRRADPQLAGD
jgi:hypothetical protein